MSPEVSLRAVRRLATRVTEATCASYSTDTPASASIASKFARATCGSRFHVTLHLGEGRRQDVETISGCPVMTALS